jgi:hypothetical protein
MRLTVDAVQLRVTEVTDEEPEVKSGRQQDEEAEHDLLQVHRDSLGLRPWASYGQGADRA